MFTLLDEPHLTIISSGLSAVNWPQSSHVDGDDIRVMVLLVADRGRDVPQQSQ